MWSETLTCAPLFTDNLRPTEADRDTAPRQRACWTEGHTRARGLACAPRRCRPTRRRRRRRHLETRSLSCSLPRMGWRANSARSGFCVVASALQDLAAQMFAPPPHSPSTDANRHQRKRASHHGLPRFNVQPQSVFRAACGFERHQLAAVVIDLLRQSSRSVTTLRMPAGTLKRDSGASFCAWTTDATQRSVWLAFGIQVPLGGIAGDLSCAAPGCLCANHAAGLESWLQ